MLGIMGYVIIGVGFTWILEGYFGFRIDSIPELYPYNIATRQFFGLFFVGAGSILEWMNGKRSRRVLYS